MLPLGEQFRPHVIPNTRPAEFTPLPTSPPEMDPDGIPYQIMRWDDGCRMAQILTQKVRTSGRHFDAIVTARRGGLFPGMVAAEGLGLPYYVYGARHYQNVEATTESLAHDLDFYLDLPSDVDLAGQSVLFVDEVNHTSVTLKGIRDALQRRFSGISFASAVMHEKPAWRQEKADFVVEKTNAWIVYPWEHEGSRELDGRQLHAPHEFFVEKFPAWMIREEDTRENVFQALHRAQNIGFLPDELPSLEDFHFLGRLATALNARYQKLFKARIPKQMLEELLGIAIGESSLVVTDGIVRVTHSNTDWMKIRTDKNQ